MTDPYTSYIFDDFKDLYSDLNISQELNYTDIGNYSDFEVNVRTQYCEPVAYGTAVNVAACVFYAVILILALPGNIIVGLVIGSKRRVLTPSDVYLFHLMVADILLALCLPFYATSMLKGWLFGDTICKLVNLMEEASFYSSILFLVCISVDRYQVIVRAMEIRKAKWRLGSCFICLSVWVLAVVLSLPALYNQAFQTRNGGVTCTEHYDTDSAEEWRLATRILRHLLGFLVPLAIMMCCYGVTVARLLRTHGFKRQRAMRVIVAVVMGFLFCWTPYHLTTMVDTLLRTKAVKHGCHTLNSVDVAMFISKSLALLHCCINPVLYAFVGEKFRSNLKSLMHRRPGMDRGSLSRVSRTTSQTSDHPSNTVL